METPVYSAEQRCRMVLENLRRNRMDGFYAKNCAEARAYVRTVLDRAKTVACGGSQTLAECGIQEDLIDHPGYLNTNVDDAALREERYRQSFSADVYLASANAVIEDGRLYFVDGRSNRIAAIAFGPKEVVIVAGYNKLCGSLEEAAERVRGVAAPKNSLRLGKKTCCAATGHCAYRGEEPGVVCKSDDCICCNTMIAGFSRTPNRMTVVLVGEELGY